MQLTFLGTGGGLPSPRRGVSAAAVQIGRDVVVDCGEGTQSQFMLSSVSFMKISHVFITHFHGDHFLGLPGLLQSMSFSRRESPIWICGPEGMVELTRTVLELGYFDPGYEIIAQVMRDGDMVDIGDRPGPCCKGRPYHTGIVLCSSRKAAEGQVPGGERTSARSS